MRRILGALAFFLLSAIPLQAAVPHWKANEIQPGMKGYGLSVFRGDEPERFDFEVLGVIDDGLTSGFNYVFGRCTGGPDNILAEAEDIPGGMSGSPVYVDEKLVGALSFSWQAAKSGVCGITLFENMTNEETTGAKQNAYRAQVPPFLRATYEGRAIVLTPLLSPQTVEKKGGSEFERRLSVFQPNSPATVDAPDKKFVPGSSISVAIVTGDQEMAATGTVTAVDGDTVYAFGHSFFGDGAVEYPAWRSPIVGVVPNVLGSFKISSSAWKGERAAIVYDGNFGVYGKIGREVNLIPFEIGFSGRSGSFTLRSNFIRTNKYVPLLTQYLSLAALERYPGVLERANLEFQGRIVIEGAPEVYFKERFPPVDQTEYGDKRAPFVLGTRYFGAMAALLEASPDIRFERLQLNFAESRPTTFALERAFVKNPRVRRGAALEVVLSVAETGSLSNDKRRERLSTVAKIAIPPNVEPGTYRVVVASAENLEDERFVGKPFPGNLTALIQRLNSQLLENGRVYLQTSLEVKKRKSERPPVEPAGEDEEEEDSDTAWQRVLTPPKDPDAGRTAVLTESVVLPDGGVFMMRGKPLEFRFEVLGAKPVATHAADSEEDSPGFWKRFFSPDS